MNLESQAVDHWGNSPAHSYTSAVWPQKAGHCFQCSLQTGSGENWRTGLHKLWQRAILRTVHPSATRTGSAKSHGSKDNRWGSAKKGNKCISILKCHEKLQIRPEIPRKFLSGKWQYWSNHHKIPTAGLLSFSKVGVPKDMDNYCRGFLHERGVGSGEGWSNHFNC